jgi:[NiFe] hydrogenase assembly HybE family chaperone
VTPRDGAGGEAVDADLAAAFARIHRERMAGLPILHPALAVRVVAGRDWQGHRVAVLVTPWCMNLVLVPAADSGLASAGPGTSPVLDFPAGRFEFVVSELDDFGPIAACSLFSPMQDFADQAAAEATATAVMQALFTPESAGGAAQEPAAAGGGGHAPAGSRRRNAVPMPTDQGQGQGISRRDLLRGSLRRRRT